MADTHPVCVVGAAGRMGKAVLAALHEEPSLVVAGALESPGHPGLGSQVETGIHIVEDAETALSSCAVAIDFSVPAATVATARVAAEAGVAYVTGTTGFAESDRAALEEVAKRVPVLHAANFSLAVHVLAWLAREAARRLGAGYDAEIFELHHSAKRDAPSGTALHLARAVAQGQGRPVGDRLVLERSGEIGARPEDAIGVQTLRGGDNPGEHTLYFVGRGERLELSHRSFTREHFARGAVRAAAWLAGRPPGLYTIEQSLGL
jgi:4-hydroxy-tetrahydrodipicolinate reductase